MRELERAAGLNLHITEQTDMNLCLPLPAQLTMQLARYTTRLQSQTRQSKVLQCPVASLQLRAQSRSCKSRIHYEISQAMMLKIYNPDRKNQEFFYTQYEE